MPGYVAPDETPTTPFGRREILRSTNPKPQTESYTLAASTVPAQTIDGNPGQKVLQPGLPLAKITSGPEAGKVGPYQAGATDGRQTLANIVGINFTFLPWQALFGDDQVSVITNGTLVQAWCRELDASGAEVALANATADSLRGGKRLDINFA